MTGSEAGFTLVEVLASLVLLALLSMLLATGLDAGRRAEVRLEAAGVAGEAVQSAQGRLRARLERVFPTVDFRGGRLVDFRGEGTELEFSAPPEDAGAPGALNRYRLDLGGDGALQLASRSDLSAEPEGYAARTTLLSGVQGLDIAYFGATVVDRTPRWRPNWEQQPRPPQAVRVRLALPSGDRRFWPDLVVRIGANVDNGCVLNPADGSCAAGAQ